MFFYYALTLQNSYWDMTAIKSDPCFLQKLILECVANFSAQYFAFLFSFFHLILILNVILIHKNRSFRFWYFILYLDFFLGSFSFFLLFDFFVNLRQILREIFHEVKSRLIMENEVISHY